MANDFDNTALNAVVKELWDEKIEDARYAEGVIMNAVSNKSEIAKKKGDIIHVTIDQKYTVGNVGSDGTFTPQNYTPTTSDVTLNIHEQVAIRILDRAQSQAFWTPESKFPTNVGKAMANSYDAKLAANHASVAAGNIVGNPSTPNEMDLTLARESVLVLANSNIPMDDTSEMTWVFHPTSYFNGILSELQLTAADQSGASQSVMRTGATFPLLGFPVKLSTNIVRTGTPLVCKNLLLHKSSMAIAWQRDSEIDRARGVSAGILADILVAQSLYGHNVIRSDHFVVINTRG